MDWRLRDPALSRDEGTSARTFEDVFRGLERRIRLLIALAHSRAHLQQADLASA
jgi:hypothetical protein